MTILRVAAVASALIAGNALETATRAEDAFVTTVVPVAALQGLATPDVAPVTAQPAYDETMRPSMEVQLATGDGQQGDVVRPQTVIASSAYAGQTP